MQTKKCVVVGDKDVGKQSLFVSYTTKKFPLEYVATIFVSYEVNVMVGDEPHALGLFSIGGQEDFDRLRPLSHPESDVFLVCFSLVSPSSFANIQNKWVPEITHYCEKTPFLLVGTQIDLRDEADVIENRISYEMGENQAKDLRAVKYVECSALTQKAVNNVLDEAVLVALEHLDPKEMEKCVLL